MNLPDGSVDTTSRASSLFEDRDGLWGAFLRPGGESQTISTERRPAVAVDVVVVSYNSRDRLRGAVEELARTPGIRVFVVDNASGDGSLDAVADLEIEAFHLERNGGFAHGCNVGWRAGGAPFVLFLNPDARIDAAALGHLVRVLNDHPSAGATAPRIVDLDGRLDYSLRRFPRLLFTFSHALFLHRIFPRAPLLDEIRDERVYDRAGTPEWVAGACILVRRAALEQIGGLDERFFLYCEDIDLCRRLWDSGWQVRYEPGAVCEHEGGASAPRGATLPLLAASRVKYARKYRSKVGTGAERLGLGLAALTHSLVSRGVRRGHLESLRILATRQSGEG